MDRFFPLLAVLIWTGNTLVTKAAATVIAPAVIAFDRWAIAGLVLLPFAGRAVWARRAEVLAFLPRLAVLGALGMAAYQGLAYQAALTTPASHMAVMLALSPLWSSLLGSALAHERPSRSTWIGAALSLAGVAIIAGRGDPRALLHGGFTTGDGLMMLAVVSNALYGVLLRRWPTPLTTWQQVLVQIGVGVLILVPFRALAPSAPLQPAAVPLILYAAIPASLGAPYCWIRGVAALGPARASLFMNLLPVLVTLAAWPLLGEVPHAYHLVGGALALGGVALGQRK